MKFTNQPVKFPVLRTHGLSSEKGATFGMTRNGGKRAHQGIDLAVPNGYKCYAVEDGEVVAVNHSQDGYGNVVILKLNCPEKPYHNMFAVYSHLSSIYVRVGDEIKASVVVGLSGDTGNAKGMETIKQGAHLHFELRTQKIAGLGLQNRIDPLPFIQLIEKE